MSFEILFANRTHAEREELKASPAKAGLIKQVHKALAYLQANPRHPLLQTHVFSAFENPFDPTGKVFEAYSG